MSAHAPASSALWGAVVYTAASPEQATFCDYQLAHMRVPWVYLMMKDFLIMLYMAGDNPDEPHAAL
jgi:hypothetical protein